MKYLFFILFSISIFAQEENQSESDSELKSDDVSKKMETPPKKIKRKKYEDEEEDNDENQTSSKDSNAIYFELLGKGFLYTIGYDHEFDSGWAIGTGISSWSASSDLGIKIKILTIPVYGTYYFSQDKHRGFIQSGIDIINASVKSDYGAISGSGLVPFFSGGYEYRNGFLFRVQPYLFVGGGGAQLWLGLTFGGAF